MTIRRILIDGDPVLHSPTRPVTAFDSGLRELVTDMFDTMYAGGGVGLAANQIGVNLRVFVYDCLDAYGDRWRGREEELAASPGALRSYREAVAVGDPEAVPAWAGEDIDLIHDIEPAAAIVETLASGAEHALAWAVSGRLSRPPLVSACPGLGMATQARVLYLLRSGTTGRRATAERQATTVSVSAVRIESISPGKRVSRSSLRRHM